MKRLFVTGMSGFVGPHVRERVAAGPACGYTLVGDQAEFDLRDATAVHAAVRELRPDAVLHLAAQSFVPAAIADPQGTYAVNVLGTLNLLQALAATGFKGRFLYVSSGDVYGLVEESALPVLETRAPAPRNPYAASKVAAEVLCLQRQRSDGLDCVVARPFNHIGPGQDERFVVASLARQVAAIAAGVQPPVIAAGDIDVTRDFTAVADVVDGYLALLERGRSGEVYNIASGRETRVRDVLVQLCELAGVPVEIRQDASRLRPAEQRRMQAAIDKIGKDCAWQPRTPLRDTLQAILGYWNSRIGR